MSFELDRVRLTIGEYFDKYATKEFRVDFDENKKTKTGRIVEGYFK